MLAYEHCWQKRRILNRYPKLVRANAGGIRRAKRDQRPIPTSSEESASSTPTPQAIGPALCADQRRVEPAGWHRQNQLIRRDNSFRYLHRRKHQGQSASCRATPATSRHRAIHLAAYNLNAASSRPGYFSRVDQTRSSPLGCLIEWFHVASNVVNRKSRENVRI